MDGASRGISGLGGVIRMQMVILVKASSFFGQATNFKAELVLFSKELNLV